MGAEARAHAAPDVVVQDVRWSAWRSLGRFSVQLVCRFVAGLDRHFADAALVKPVVDRAHVLGIHALGVGVETAAQAEILEPRMRRSPRLSLVTSSATRPNGRATEFAGRAEPELTWMGTEVSQVAIATWEH
jgi:hypothetical protein